MYLEISLLALTFSSFLRVLLLADCLCFYILIVKLKSAHLIEYFQTTTCKQVLMFKSGGGNCYFSKITSSIHCSTMICQRNNTFKIPVQGLPRWLSGKEFACQCRRHKFYLWLGKIPHATEQLSLCTTSIHNCWAHVPWLLVPACLEPMLCHKRSHCNVKPVHRDWRAALTLHNQRKARAATKTQHSQK